MFLPPRIIDTSGGHLRHLHDSLTSCPQTYSNAENVSIGTRNKSMSNKDKRSRLEKLLCILEDSNQDQTLRLAAQKIADVALQQPHHIPSVLRQVHKKLYSKEWKARVYAGDVLADLAQRVEHCTVDCRDALQQEGTNADRSSALQNFSFNAVLLTGETLVSGSQGNEPAPLSFDEVKSQLSRIKARFGLDAGCDAAQAGGASNGEALGSPAASPAMLQTNVQGSNSPFIRSGKRKRCDTEKEGSPSVADQTVGTVNNGNFQSARERNKIKRQVRGVEKQASGVLDGKSPSITPQAAAETDQTAAEDEQESERIANGGWPFQRVADQLVAHLLDANWRVRHGAAVGLRQILREQAGCAAVEVPIADPLTGWRRRGGSGPMDRSEMTREQRATAVASNNLWLQDAMAVLLVLLVLDRFADYHNDSATAPVRETAAQALAVAAAASPQAVRQQLLEQLINLQLCEVWEVRHGSMMCIKCIMAVDTVAAGAMVHRILPVLMQGMRDTDDDVRASAVQACVPLANSLVRQAPDLVSDLIACLWELLPSFDVVSPAPASVLQLLGIVTAHCMESCPSKGTLDAPTIKMEGKDGAESDQTTIRRDPATVHSAELAVGTEMKAEIKTEMKTEIDATSAPDCTSYVQSFTEHMPLLWPFFDHNSTQVRHACINCCIRVWTALLGLPESKAHYSSALQTMFRLTYQVFVVASDPDLYKSSEELLLLILKHAPSVELSEALDAATIYALMDLPCTAMGAPLPEIRLLRFPASDSGGLQQEDIDGLGGISSFKFGEQSDEDSENVAIQRRVACARIVGLAASVTAGTDKGKQDLTAYNFQNLIHTFLLSNQGLQRSFGALVMRSWLQLHADPKSAIPDTLSTALFKALEESPTLALQDIVGPIQTMHACLGQVLEQFTAAGTPLHLPPEIPLNSVTTTYATEILNGLVGYGDIAAGQREACRAAIYQVESINSSMRMRLAAVVAAACVACKQLPDKISSVIQPLMAGLRKMPETSLRKQVIAAALAEVVTMCIDHKPSAVDKILSHLRTFACNTVSEQPLPTLKHSLSSLSLPAGSSIPALNMAEAAHPVVDSPETLAREGAEATLQHVVSNLGVKLLDRLPQLWDMVTTPIVKLAASCNPSGSNPGQLADAVNAVTESQMKPAANSGSNRASQEQMAAESMQMLQCVAPALHAQIHARLATHVTQMMQCMVHVPAEFRSAVCGGIVRLTAAQPSIHLDAVITALLPCLESSASLNQRSAGIMLLAELLADEGPLIEPLLPYAALLTVPTLALMTDPDTDIRTTAAAAFGRLMSVLPIAMNQPLPELSTLDSTLREKRKSDLRFLEQLLDSQSVASFDPPVQPNGVKLRAYQREGVSWLAFLQKCGLHGVLADDMGLGKTVQTLTIIACSMATPQGAALESAKSNGQRKLPSLIICPATLLGHWVQETRRYFGHIGLLTVRYQGTSEQRHALQKQVRGGVLVVASYESVRSDAVWFASQHFQYCALDEGHIIRNSKAKVTKACKQINANHRLVLSGTPVQNSVTELWSLFDFLMPGYLGTETEFNSKYRSAVSMPKRTAARNSHCKSHLGVLDSLHKQVLPFVLRRTKEQVLNDLPPKIIQDIVCELTPLQQQLYEVAMSGTSTDAIKAASSAEGQSAQGAAGTPVFHVLQRLRKLCSHPKLMLDMDDKAHLDALRSSFPDLNVRDREAVNTQLRKIDQAPKLMAFRQLLSNASIISGAGGSTGNGETGDAIAGDTGQHRVLCFAQMKATLDLVESVVLDPDGVSYLRLDGDVSPARRSEVVQQFNTDPTVDVMLLTTAAGCHGLNLTTANVVVFLEHDWNPMKDMQAMDRAHRLGQRRTVTVYRLLTEGTLEEHIMSLQQFKVNVANTVVSADNVAMDTMDTSSVLELMSGSAGQGKDRDGSKGGGGVPTGKTGPQITSQPGQQEGFDKEYNDFSIEQFMHDANSIRPKRKI